MKLTQICHYLVKDWGIRHYLMTDGSIRHYFVTGTWLFHDEHIIQKKLFHFLLKINLLDAKNYTLP